MGEVTVWSPLACIKNPQIGEYFTIHIIIFIPLQVPLKINEASIKLSLQKINPQLFSFYTFMD